MTDELTVTGDTSDGRDLRGRAPGADPGPSVDDLEGIAQLRSVLDEVGYTPAAVRFALATEVATSRESAELPLYLRMLPDGEPLATLIKLFLLAVETPAAEAAEALAPIPLERLEAMGVLSASRGDGAGTGSVRAALELVPTDDLIIACDPFQAELGRPDHVLGVSPPARVLASLTVRRPVDRVLDLGIGNGHQAILASRHAETVVGADINPRALRFAAFNAVLNRASGIECREGNLFDPVEGSTFDLIVCNPPYVISPETDIAYRDGGLPGDSFCEQIVRGLPAHLRPDGIAEVLISWLHPTDADWTTPVRAWVEGSGCDAILLRYAVHLPLDYAAGWNRPYRPDPAVYAANLDRWSEYFDALGVESISWGALILRRRSGHNWFWAYGPSSQGITGASDQVLRLFAAQDYLAEAGEEDLLASAFALVEDHRVEQTIRLGDGGAFVERNVLRLEGGLRFEVAIDPSTERVLALADGSRPLREVLLEVAAAVGMAPEAFIAAAVPVVRRLVELGFLVEAQPQELEPK